MVEKDSSNYAFEPTPDRSTAFGAWPGLIAARLNAGVRRLITQPVRFPHR